MTIEKAPCDPQDCSKKNKFYTYVDKVLLPFDPYYNHKNLGWGRYYSKIFRIIDQALPNQGLVFYVLMTEVKELPTYGSNVFVFLLGDEFHRIPRYTDKVGGIFRCFGTHQFRDQIDLYRPFFKPSLFKAILLAQSIRNLSLRLPLKIEHSIKLLKNFLLGSQAIAPIYDVPLGYYNSEDLPIKAINSREFDVFFEGSVIHGKYSLFSPSRWLKTPKAYSRGKMFENLLKIKEKHPEYTIDLASTAGFAKRASEGEEPVSYSQRMMNTKICLTPRGTTQETYRLFEGLRYGCIIISDGLPKRWFYDDAPIVQVKDWSELEEVMANLFEDKDRLNDLHQQTLDWWQNKCSEDVVGWYCAEKVNALLNRDKTFAPVSLKRLPVG